MPERFDGNYRAKVLDNVDPEQLGRIKAEVYPMLLSKETAKTVGLDGIDTDVLPWVVPATPLLVGAGSGTGTFSVPDIGSMVWVFFENGVIYQPVYFAEALDGVVGLPSNRVKNYPKRRVIKTSSGAVIIIDDKTGDVIITGAKDVVIQGDTSVRINPLSKVE